MIRMIVLMVLAGSATEVSAEPASRFLGLKDRQVVTQARFLDDIGGSRVIFLGETHDSEAHHRTQLDVVRNLVARKIPVAIGIEMFSYDGQKYLDDWVQGKVDEGRFRNVFAAYWSYDWNLYRDLFLFARDNRIPLVALNVPKRLVSTVVKGGETALSPGERRDLPPDLSWDLNPAQMEYIRRITAQVFGSGAPAPPIPVRNFAQAQALRNGMMAWKISQFRINAPKTRMVVLTGTWHAVRNGAPEALAKYGNPPVTVVLPELPEMDKDKMTTEEADYLLLK